MKSWLQNTPRKLVTFSFQACTSVKTSLGLTFEVFMAFLRSKICQPLLRDDSVERCLIIRGVY